MVRQVLLLNKKVQKLCNSTHLFSMEKYLLWVCGLIKAYYIVTMPISAITLNKKAPEKKESRRVIVSLTSIPSRINTVWITLESLYRQSYKPDKIILYLARDEFDSVDVPNSVKKYEKRGLEIVYCDNLKSHKKYYYTMKNFSEDLCLTVDDDIIYSEDMILNLMGVYERNPLSIVCCRANIVKRINGDYIKYYRWKSISQTNRSIIRCEDIFFTTGGGTIFPSWKMPKETFDMNTMLQLCETADDIWLNYMARIGNLSVLWTETIDNDCLFFWPAQKNSLSNINIGENENDKCLERMKKKFGFTL